ncbi:MAG: glycosyltransferase family 9 protein [Phycisphaerales bacterium]|nr:glycosyltransferase family 9 protein [Phycisphaerales bacterium]
MIKKLLYVVWDWGRWYLFAFVEKMLLWLTPKPPVNRNRILIVKLDNIGDYILFRNYIYALKNEYPHFEITLVGNIQCSKFVRALDQDLFVACIWVDIKPFYKNILYRIKKMTEIIKVHYTQLIVPRYSTYYLCEDSIVKVAYAQEKIGTHHHWININHPYLFKKTATYYTRLYPVKSIALFEYLQHRQFMNFVFHKDFSLVKLSLDLPSTLSKKSLPYSYIVFFVGASNTLRKWGAQNYWALALLCYKQFQCPIVFCGDTSDLKNFEPYIDLFNDNPALVNLIGKTTILELLAILNNAQWVVTNDTMACHAAVAMNKKTFVISNGMTALGRLLPYPKEISSNATVILPKSIESKIDEIVPIVNNPLFDHTQLPSIQSISVPDVFNKLLEVV